MLFISVFIKNKEERIIPGDADVINRCFEESNKLKIASKKARLRLYKTVINPTVLYGSEIWVLTQTEEQKLEI